MGNRASDSVPRRGQLLELQNQLAAATHARETAEGARQAAEARADEAERQMRDIARERDEWKRRALVAERELSASVTAKRNELGRAGALRKSQKSATDHYYSER